MAVKEAYDVLRLIEHNQMCYISSEYVNGCSLIRWIKYHPCMDKKEVFYFIREIVRQLSVIHRCRGNPCYRYVNPYSIIISEKRSISFLDMNAEDNVDQLRLMQRRSVREFFLPPDEPYYQKSSIELDIYGLGKTLQYLLSQTDIEPPLTRGEEAKFQKIISKCLKRNSKKSFQNVSEIQNMIPKYKQVEKEGKRGKKLLFVISAAMIGIAAHTILGIPIEKANQNRKTIKQENWRKTETFNESEFSGYVDEKEKEIWKSEELHMKLGLVYFLELRNYEKSREYYQNVKNNKLAEYMAVISGCFSNSSFSMEDMKHALEGAESELLNSRGEESEKQKYYECILKGYAFLGTKDTAQDVIRIGKICLEDQAGENLSEVLGYMAAANERLEDKKEAVRLYEQQMEHEESEEIREGLYVKIGILLTEMKQMDTAQETLRKGIEEFGRSQELRVNYIKIQLQDSHMDRKVCIQNINQQLKEMPELKDQEELQKLLKEYGITRKGEKVWQGK